MNALTIYTNHPDTVAKLLISEELIESHHIIEKLDILLKIKQPDYGMCQALQYWLDIARAIGLVTSYSPDQQNRISPSQGIKFEIEVAK